jgi:hydrogenase maturation factor
LEILETGKLKSDFLEKLLGKIEIKDEKVVVGPGIGEDAAALDIGENYLLVKSDPITFVSDRIGWYSVNVNANDIAAMGGTPRWFLVTIMLPEGRTTPGDIEDIMSDLRISCEELGIVLIGGHTEITHGLKNPILSGTMLGEAKKGELIRNGNIEEGDLLYMTKGVAIEATSIIAREKKEDIIRIFGRNFYTRCINFLEKPGLSVVGDAYRARSITRVSGMHDPTEGGILAGAFEMARCSQKGLEIYLEKIPVYEETKKLCEHFHISPYGSIASGSLLISAKTGRRIRERNRRHAFSEQDREVYPKR